MTAVRALRAGDEAAWRPLWRGYLAFYRTALPEAVYAETFARMVDPGQPEQFGLVAERDGRLVGLAHCILHRHGWRPEGVCYLQDLYVDPEARGSGAGRLLIEAVYGAADALGRPEVYWLTEAQNETARRLYDRIGVATTFVKYRRPDR
jgi:GNAT superfamily N-acetyltransferase